MPCRQVSTFNGTSGSGQSGGGGFLAEADCLNACKEGACCTTTGCSVKPQCQCQGSFVGVGTSCSDSPCCPGCVPRTTENPDGKCCRSVYIGDGTGLCCPNDCCGFLPPAGTPIAADGKNGACCPDAKPFCCNNSSCQTVPPTPCAIGGYIAQPDGCSSSRQFTIAVESGPFTMGLQSYGQEFRQNRGIVFQAAPQAVFVNYGSGEVQMPAVPNTSGNPFQLLQHMLTFCKPRGVTSISVRVESVRAFVTSCTSGFQSNGIVIGPECDCDGAFIGTDGVPIGNQYTWAVWAYCLNGCACDDEANPLP